MAWSWAASAAKASASLGASSPGSVAHTVSNAAWAGPGWPAASSRSPWYHTARQSASADPARKLSTALACSRSPPTMSERASASCVSGDPATAAGVLCSLRTAAISAAVRCSGSSVLSVARYPAAGSVLSTWGTGSPATTRPAAGAG